MEKARQVVWSTPPPRQCRTVYRGHVLISVHSAKRRHLGDYSTCYLISLAAVSSWYFVQSLLMPPCKSLNNYLLLTPLSYSETYRPNKSLAQLHWCQWTYAEAEHGNGIPALAKTRFVFWPIDRMALCECRAWGVGHPSVYSSLLSKQKMPKCIHWSKELNLWIWPRPDKLKGPCLCCLFFVYLF